MKVCFDIAIPEIPVDNEFLPDDTEKELTPEEI